MDNSSQTDLIDNLLSETAAVKAASITECERWITSKSPEAFLIQDALQEYPNLDLNAPPFTSESVFIELTEIAAANLLPFYIEHFLKSIQLLGEFLFSDFPNVHLVHFLASPNAFYRFTDYIRKERSDLVHLLIGFVALVDSVHENIGFLEQDYFETLSQMRCIWLK